MPFHSAREVRLQCAGGLERANVSLGPGEFSDTHEVARVCRARGLVCEHWGAEELEAPAWEVAESEGYVIRGGECPRVPGDAVPPQAEEPAPPEGGAPGPEAATVIPLPYHLRYGAPGTVLPRFGYAQVFAGVAAMLLLSLWLVAAVVRHSRRPLGAALG